MTETVSRVPRTGGSLQPLYVVPLRALALAVDATDLYWTDFSGGIQRAPKDGFGAPELIAGGEYIGTILVDGEELFWNRHHLEEQRDCIHSAGIDGSAQRTVWCQDGPILTIAIDTERIYWGGYPTALQSAERNP